ncbi:MAG: L,D-transpeptidase family protein [Candidatus Pseudobacter hemicellulosilyticus]|uniref:L,D-transpeptidase family protein n=1 Tax=Candidatus Pseudobacter hemicellulosilyticus TaxID=3121375 RepID=A0AAJ5WSU6_9BACT|nr:MAG: L,D-transpeptidase family protein [Pseudobacter sp.]
MQKLILLLLTISTVFVACSDEAGKDKQAKKELLPRDRSITAANAYSDLFLDSNAVEAFIREQQLNDTLADGLRNFYNYRNYQYAWFASDGLTEQALGFRNLYDYNKDSSTNRKTLDKQLEALTLEDDLRVAANDAGTRKTELLLTWRFLNYLGDTYNSDKKRIAALQQLVPVKKYSIPDLVKRDKEEDDGATEAYHRMQQRVAELNEQQQKGGWPAIPAPKKSWKKGSREAGIVLLKKRLQAAGLSTGKDTSASYTDELEPAVKQAQTSFGLKADGIITPALVKALNVPLEQRMEQVLVNMERMRWMPAEPQGKLLLVNIPAFTLYAQEGNQPAFAMDIVVGKEGHSTVMFTGQLNQVVFSPYWNLPSSIVRKEVLPHIEKDKGYLAKNDMEVVGEEGGVPKIRQRPGNQNQLGKVKFLFPNSYNIYFHDTPFKELFNKDNRAYSHGCIRLREPAKLAQYLLQDQPQWTPTAIDSAMNSGKEKFVKVSNPVPVLIYYYTAWVDDNNQLQFRDDIYGHDKKMASKLLLQNSAAQPLAMHSDR